MPAITLHPPSKERASDHANPLPQLLHTPSGLAIVEIQGTINSTLSAGRTSGPRGAIPLGKLTFPLYDASSPASDTSWQKRVHLYVGDYQRLTGEVKKLVKPVAILRTRDCGNHPSPATEELEVAEIVYYKVLFAHRPEPVGGLSEAQQG